jgi:hypothetical protein
MAFAPFVFLFAFIASVRGRANEEFDDEKN